MNFFLFFVQITNPLVTWTLCESRSFKIPNDSESFVQYYFRSNIPQQNLSHSRRIGKVIGRQRVGVEIQCRWKVVQHRKENKSEQNPITMAVVKRPNQSRASNINVFQLSLGIFIGALGMNLMIGGEDYSNEFESVVVPKDSSAWTENNIRKLNDPSRATGWHQINVFFGEKDGLFNDAPDDVKSNQESFAQVGQDSIILDLLGPNGYFIDLAANDALILTNTLALERKGWNGLCVEPNPDYWYGLAHRKCTVVGALVAGTKSEKVKVKFRGVFGGIVGKLDNRLADRKKEPDTPEVTRYTVPITEVLNRYNVPKMIDYMSLDVEGSEFEVMKDFPFKKYTIRVMSVERPNKQLKQLLADNGYIYLAELANWGEYLWCHTSSGFSPDHELIKTIKAKLYLK